MFLLMARFAFQFFILLVMTLMDMILLLSAGHLTTRWKVYSGASYQSFQVLLTNPLPMLKLLNNGGKIGWITTKKFAASLEDQQRRHMIDGLSYFLWCYNDNNCSWRLRESVNQVLNFDVEFMQVLATFYVADSVSPCGTDSKSLRLLSFLKGSFTLISLVVHLMTMSTLFFFRHCYVDT